VCCHKHLYPSFRVPSAAGSPLRGAPAQALKNESITVSDLLIDNIDFAPELKKPIENKQIASQNALVEQQWIHVSKPASSSPLTIPVYDCRFTRVSEKSCFFLRVKRTVSTVGLCQDGHRTLSIVARECQLMNTGREASRDHAASAQFSVAR
jgi:hypothetical protein